MSHLTFQSPSKSCFLLCLFLLMRVVVLLAVLGISVNSTKFCSVLIPQLYRVIQTGVTKRAVILPWGGEGAITHTHSLSLSSVWCGVSLHVWEEKKASLGEQQLMLSTFHWQYKCRAEYRQTDAPITTLVKRFIWRISQIADAWQARMIDHNEALFQLILLLHHVIWSAKSSAQPLRLEEKKKSEIAQRNLVVSILTQHRSNPIRLWFIKKYICCLYL